MAEKVLSMVKSSLDSLVQMDPELARRVCEEDDEVDVINRKAYSKVQERIRQYPERVTVSFSSRPFPVNWSASPTTPQHCRRGHLPYQRRNRPP